MYEVCTEKITNCQHSARVAGGLRRPKIPPLPAAGAHGGRRLEGAQVGARVLHLRKVAFRARRFRAGYGGREFLTVSKENRVSLLHGSA